MSFLSLNPILADLQNASVQKVQIPERVTNFPITRTDLGKHKDLDVPIVCVNNFAQLFVAPGVKPDICSKTPLIEWEATNAQRLQEESEISTVFEQSRLPQDIRAKLMAQADLQNTQRIAELEKLLMGLIHLLPAAPTAPIAIPATLFPTSVLVAPPAILTAPSSPVVVPLVPPPTALIPPPIVLSRSTSLSSVSARNPLIIGTGSTWYNLLSARGLDANNIDIRRLDLSNPNHYKGLEMDMFIKYFNGQGNHLPTTGVMADKSLTLRNYMLSRRTVPVAPLAVAPSSPAVGSSHTLPIPVVVTHGSGIQYIPMGKLLIHKDKLHKSILSLSMVNKKHNSLVKVDKFKNMTITPTLRDTILKLISTLDIPDLSDLSVAEREYLYRLIARSDISVNASTRQQENISSGRVGVRNDLSAPYRSKLKTRLQNRFNVLIGEISAGNVHNPAIKSEFTTVLKSLLRHKVVSPEEATQMRARFL